MRAVRTLCVMGIAGLLIGPANADITLTMEEFLGNDTGALATYYVGVTFESGAGGSDWVARDATTNNYQISSWPSGQSWLGGYYWIYDYVGATTALDYTGNDGIIRFDNQDATYVELGYCSGSDLTLQAFDADGNLIMEDTGSANRRYIEGNESGPGTLRVDWDGTNYIAYVSVHDQGNYWIVDDIRTDASIHIIPAPGAALLGVIGLGLVGWIRRRAS